MTHEHDDGCTIQTSEGYVCRQTGECLDGLLLVSWGFDDNMRADSTFRYTDAESENDRREMEISRIAHSILQRVLLDVLRCDESIVTQWFAVPQAHATGIATIPAGTIHDVFGQLSDIATLYNAASKPHKWELGILQTWCSETHPKRIGDRYACASLRRIIIEQLTCIPPGPDRDDERCFLYIVHQQLLTKL